MRTMISRRGFIGGVGSLAPILADVCFANSRYPAPSWQEWKKIPSIVAIATDNDARLTAVYDAVAFWNAALRNIGSSFRLGPVTRRTDATLYGNLHKYSDLGSLGDLRAFYSGDAFNLHDLIAPVNENIVILLSDRDGVSFARDFPWLRKVFVVIYNNPFARPQVVHNVIAHELGHAIGLGHNGEADTLMCGGTASCILNAGDGFLPLARGDRTTLLKMYPPGWQPEASRKSVDGLSIPPLR